MAEPVELPPALVIQRRKDDAHPLEMQERLVHWYRERGGQIEMPLFDNLPPSPFRLSPSSPIRAVSWTRIRDFIEHTDTREDRSRPKSNPSCVGPA